jgi:hypothetical protein
MALALPYPSLSSFPKNAFLIGDKILNIHDMARDVLSVYSMFAANATSALKDLAQKGFAHSAQVDQIYGPARGQSQIGNERQMLFDCHDPAHVDRHIHIAIRSLFTQSARPKEQSQPQTRMGLQSFFLSFFKDHVGFGTLPPCRVTFRQAGDAFALYEFESL